MKKDKLVALRKERGMTQAEVASELGISRSMYAMIELGERVGSYYTLKRIADFYQRPLEEILEMKQAHEENNKRRT